jgi:hypothetical protein
VDTLKLRRELDTLLETVQDEPLLADTKFMIEPGRYLVGEAGVYMTRVNDIKVSRGQKFLILDGGMQKYCPFVAALALSGGFAGFCERCGLLLFQAACCDHQIPARFSNICDWPSRYLRSLHTKGIQPLFSDNLAEPRLRI